MFCGIAFVSSELRLITDTQSGNSDTPIETPMDQDGGPTTGNSQEKPGMKVYKDTHTNE